MKDNYKVFISFKNTDGNGRRTKDSDVAEQIYNFLQRYGVNAFYSNVEIRESNYLDSIANALNQSKILLIVGSKREYLESKWVKDEYEKFFTYKKDSPPRYIIMIEPFELPLLVANVQKYDYNESNIKETLIDICISNGVDINSKKYYTDKSKNSLEILVNQFNKIEKSNNLFNKKEYNSLKSTFLQDIERLLKSNISLKIKNEELQIDLKEFNDSLVYCRNKIQKPSMFSCDQLNSFFGNDKWLLIDIPKEIVSGDFCLFKEYENKKVIIVADSRGVGVPAAIYSSIGKMALNNISITENIDIIDQFVFQYRNSIYKYFVNDLLDSNFLFDNQDLFVFNIYVYDKENGELEIANFNKYSVLIINDKLEESIKSNKFLPSKVDISSNEIVKYKFNVNQGDRLYSFTDGYHDQFGGQEGRKYKLKNLINYIWETRLLRMGEQQKALLDNYNSWKGNSKQIDDVLILGIEF